MEERRERTPCSRRTVWRERGDCSWRYLAISSVLRGEGGEREFLERREKNISERGTKKSFIESVINFSTFSRRRKNEQI